MHIDTVKKLIQSYFETKKASPNSIRLYSIQKNILFAVLEGEGEHAKPVTKKDIQDVFLKRLYAITSCKFEIEKAIKDREAIPNFTHLEDYDFSTLKYDNKRVAAMITQFFTPMGGNITNVREAIMIEAILSGADLAVVEEFTPRITNMICDHFEDRIISRLAELNFTKLLRDFCIEALTSVCRGGIRMKLEDEKLGYSFNSAFMSSLVANAMVMDIIPSKFSFPLSSTETVEVKPTVELEAAAKNKVTIQFAPPELPIETIAIDETVFLIAAPKKNIPIPIKFTLPELPLETIEVVNNAAPILLQEEPVSMSPLEAIVKERKAEPISLQEASVKLKFGEQVESQTTTAIVQPIKPSESPSFVQRHPGLFAYLAVLGFIALTTVALIALCFIPVIGPVFSAALGSSLSGICSLFGLQAGLNALAATVSTTLFATFGATFSLSSAAGVLAVSFLGAINAISLSISTGIAEGIIAFKNKAPKIPTFTNSMTSYLKPLLSVTPVTKKQCTGILLPSGKPFTLTSGGHKPPQEINTPEIRKIKEHTPVI